MTMTRQPPKPENMQFDEIGVGRNAQFTHTVTERDIELFTELTGDYHPLHHDDDYAAQTQFGSRITQGLLTASFISRIIGMHLPGKRALYLSQDLKFIRPVHIGDTLNVIGTITAKETEKRDTIVIKTDIYNQDDTLVLTGTAKVWVRSDNNK